MFQKLFDRVFRDKEGNIAIWQWPNAPLWIWIITVAVGFVAHGHLKAIASTIGSLALVIWAILEIGWGKSMFRRLLGGVVLIAIVASFAMKLHH